ncbi:MAG: threonine synthase [Bacteroidales bacterium]|nr:threonine synthase [Bacteroidales bacterium]
MSKYTYVCCNCKKHFFDEGVKYLCPDCSASNNPSLPPKGVLKVIYNYQDIKKRYFHENRLFESLHTNRYIDLLPIKSPDSLSPLRTGHTPLYSFFSKKLNDTFEEFNVFFKDDSRNPTFSLKDRASDLVSAFAKENGISTIIAASTGNAGSSIAGICASQGQKAIVMVPAKAPIAKLLQIMHYGAQIIPVDGTYDDAFELSLKASEKFGFYNRNTAYNPLTIEGKKTVAFEIFADLNKILPDLIFVSVGDGVIISGLYKGFEDLLQLGIIDRIPTIVAVQSDKSKNLIANMDNDSFILYPSSTVADSISVDVPRNFYMAKHFIKEYSGKCILVSDEEIIKASSELSNKTGIFSEPAASAAYAGFIKYINKDIIKKNQNVVILLTGSGLKDLKNVERLHEMPEAVVPDINAINNIF